MKRVVFTPELLVRGLHDAECLRVLRAWRDGGLVPVINRELAVRYTRLLREAGLGPRQLRRWLWWFTDTEKTGYHPHLETGASGAVALCEEVVLRTEAEGIVHSDVFRAPESELSWLPASRVQASE